MDGRAWADEQAERAFREAMAGMGSDGQEQNTPNKALSGPSEALNPQIGGTGEDPPGSQAVRTAPVDLRAKLDALRDAYDHAWYEGYVSDSDWLQDVWDLLDEETR